jgi:hypothetical protein
MDSDPRTLPNGTGSTRYRVETVSACLTLAARLVFFRFLSQVREKEWPVKTFLACPEQYFLVAEHMYCVTISACP